jgi:hypothetical protein
MIETKYPVLMSKEDLDDFLEKLQAVETALYELESVWADAPVEAQDMVNNASEHYPFGYSIRDTQEKFGMWNNDIIDNLRDETCQACGRLVAVERGENYQFDEKLGYYICNDCFEKKYDRKIEVECMICKKKYTRDADAMLNHRVDGSECNCPNLPFIILKEIKRGEQNDAEGKS